MSHIILINTSKPRDFDLAPMEQAKPYEQRSLRAYKPGTCYGYKPEVKPLWKVLAWMTATVICAITLGVMLAARG